MTNIVKVLRSVPEIDFFHSFPYLLKFESLGKFCTNFPLDGRMSSLQNVLFFTILFFQSRDVFDYLPRLHLRTCDSLVLSGQGRKRYASSLSAKKNPLLCRGRGFVVGRFRRRHNDGGGGLCTFATVCFAAKRDTVVFTGSFHRTSPASK